MKKYLKIDELIDNMVYKTDGEETVAIWNGYSEYFYFKEDNFINMGRHFEYGVKGGRQIKPIRAIKPYEKKYCPFCGYEDDKALYNFLSELKNRDN